MAASVQTEQEHSLPAPPNQKLLPASTGGKPGSSLGSWLRKIAVIVILLGAAALAYWKYTSNKKETEAATAKTAAAANRAIPVTVAAVGSRTMPIYLTALGTVTAYNTVTVKSRVDGQLLSVNVREGQQVKQGQVLAMIDPRPYEAIVAQAQGQLAKDQASADYAKAEAGRYTALYQAGVVSKESEQTQVSSAGASVGTLDADRAAIQAAKVNVAYTRISSPINGVVGLRQVDAGNIVHAADTTGLLVVTQLQPIAVIFTIPEDQLPSVLQRVRSGQKLVVEAYDRSEVTHLASGTLLTIDNQIDTTTGTVKAKGVFDNKDGALFPNQFVNIRLVLEERRNSLIIPASGLQSGQAGNFVYVVKPCPATGCPKASNDDGAGGGRGKNRGKSGATGQANVESKPTTAEGDEAEPRHKGPQYYVDVQPVSVDLTEGSTIILKGGVNPGDQIVVDGQEKLKKYSRVSPKKGNANGISTGAPSTDSGPPQDASGGNGAAGGVQPPAAPGTPAGTRHRQQGGGNNPDGSQP